MTGDSSEARSSGETMRLPVSWQVVGLFLIAAALLLAASGGYFLRADGLEHGDGALNALAIRDAAEFSRIHGNYSRWGFFHPGPAFYYWFAAWEWFLCDLTGLAAAPMGAHHFAIAVLNAVFLALALTICPSRGRRAVFYPVALAFAIVHFGMINRGLPTSALLSTWPPHMLMMPFALFTLACGVLGSGRLTVLPLTIFAGSMLVHGHAAHAIFVLPMFGTAAVFGWLRAPRDAAGRVGWLRPVVWSGAILAVFLVPLVIDLARGSESNLVAILQQFRAPSDLRRTWLKALLNVLSYFAYIPDQERVIQVLSDDTARAFRVGAPALAAWALVHGFLVFAWVRARRESDGRIVRSCILLVGLALVLTVLWAKIQTGKLENFNTYYLHGVALAAGWLALGQAGRWLPRANWMVAVGWGLVVAAAWVNRVPLTRVFEPQTELRERVEGLIAAGPKEAPVVVSFAHTDWPGAARLLLALNRAGVDARIGEEWTYLCGERHVLAATQDAGSVWFVQNENEPGAWMPLFEGLSVRTESEKLSPGLHEFGPATTRSLAVLAVTGLDVNRTSGPDFERTVSTSPTVRLRFRLSDEVRAVTIAMDVKSWEAPRDLEEQPVQVFVDGQRVCETTVNGSATVRFDWSVPAGLKDRIVDLRLELPRAWQPRAEGLSGDFRRFALEFQRVSITAVGETAPSP